MKVWKTVAAVLFVFAGGAALAGRPLETDDADAVEPGQAEFEAGVFYARDSALKAFEIPFGLTAGILPDVEAGIACAGYFVEQTSGAGKDRESGVGDLELGAKLKIAAEKEWLPALAVAGSVKIPTADEDKGLGSGKTDFDLTLIASRMLTETSGLHLNAGYAWIGEPSGEDVADVAHCSVALDVQLTDSVQWVGEVFAENELQGGTQALVQCNTGFRWSVSECLTLDAAAGAGLHGDDVPDFTATAGLTWALGL